MAVASDDQIINQPNPQRPRRRVERLGVDPLPAGQAGTSPGLSTSNDNVQDIQFQGTAQNLAGAEFNGKLRLATAASFSGSRSDLLK
jgi:hypothetical protein